MSLKLLEDCEVYALAEKVFKTDQPLRLKNAQLSGLLSVAQASGSYDTVRRMVDRQLAKARKEGPRAADRETFYTRVNEALADLKKLAEDHAKQRVPPCGDAKRDKKARRKVSEPTLNTLIITFATHLAAEHRWQGGA